MAPDTLAALEWAVATLASHEGEYEYECLREHLSLVHARERQWHADPTLVGFMARWMITIPQKEFGAWRMVPHDEQRLGAINALPESYGILRCTNGILCYIERSGHTPPYLGHVQHWTPEPREHALVDASRSARKPSSNGNGKDKRLEKLLREIDFVV